MTRETDLLVRIRWLCLAQLRSEAGGFPSADHAKGRAAMAGGILTEIDAALPGFADAMDEALAMAALDGAP